MHDLHSQLEEGGNLSALFSKFDLRKRKCSSDHANHSHSARRGTAADNRGFVKDKRMVRHHYGGKANGKRHKDSLRAKEERLLMR